MTLPIHNLLTDIPPAGAEEDVISLLSAPRLDVRRIVSRRHASPPGFWYDQEETEWVLVLSGSAGLQFTADSRAVVARPLEVIQLVEHLSQGGPEHSGDGDKAVFGDNGERSFCDSAALAQPTFEDSVRGHRVERGHIGPMLPESRHP